jgi:2-oxoglutarate ferredoxin oxidoreductase subunit alpha
MTPASPVLHYLAGHDEETDMAVIQAESEISAMCMVVGASYTGVRAMTSTSGGGFCLMTEALSLAGMTETPVVVMIGQRPGPSTGLATYSGQGDLLFSVFSGHGEFQRVVVAPGDVDECFYYTTEAFNLAERFQIPVIVLTDKSGIESHETVEVFDIKKTHIDRGKIVSEWEEAVQYLRYKITEDGISPRAPPGTPNTIVLATSNEHFESGHTTSRANPVNSMVEKRKLKEPYIRQAVEQYVTFKVYGDSDPDVTLVCWGSTKGPLLEAMRLLQSEGVKTRLVQVLFMEPFPQDMLEYLEGTVILFENNSTNQLAALTRMRTGYVFPHMENKYDGRPFDPEDVRDRVMEVIRC